MKQYLVVYLSAGEFEILPVEARNLDMALAEFKAQVEESKGKDVLKSPLPYFEEIISITLMR